MRRNALGHIIPRTEEELIEHLLENSIVDEETDCILWQGSVSGQMGYGVTCWEGRQVYIHRWAYQIAHPDEVIEVIRHSCDRPRCWNLDHLLNGTVQDNTNDKIERGRLIRGSKNYNARFTEAQIVEIRNSPLNLYQLAAIYDVSPPTIHYIKARKTWKHVP